MYRGLPNTLALHCLILYEQQQEYFGFDSYILEMTSVNLHDTTVHTADKDQNKVQVRLLGSSTNFKFWCIVHKMFVNLTKTSSISIIYNRIMH